MAVSLTGPVPAFLAVVCTIGFLTVIYSPPPPLAHLQPQPLAITNFTASQLRAWCGSTLKTASRLRREAKSRPVDILFVSNEIDRLLANTINYGYLFMMVHPHADPRAAGAECYQVAGENVTALSLDTEYYSLFVALDKARPSMDATTSRYLDKKLDAFKRSGVDKDPEERRRLEDLAKAMRELGQSFERNMNEDVRHIRIPASDAAQLEQLPEDFVASRVDPEKQEVVISTAYPDYFPVMKYARNRALRKRLYTKFMSRGFPGNLAILLQLLEKRHQYANAVGFDSWAAYSQADMMVKSPANVRAFLDKVGALTDDRVEVETRELLQYLKADESHDVKRVEAYDASYYINRVRDDKYRLSSKVVRSYFEYGRVREGLMSLATSLFGVVFHPVDIKAWHADVSAFNVYSTSDPDRKKVLGRVYLDMFPRDGKYQHAASFPLRDGITRRQLPEAALVCNFPKTGPMEHGDVVTFAHEFGHLLHHILGGQDTFYDLFSGVATAYDFVEAPSQMFEEWAWDHPTLASMSKDPSSGKPIPKDLVTRMRLGNEFGKGINSKQQVFYASLSLELHTNFERLHAAASPGGEGTTTLLMELQRKLSPYPYVPDTHFQANFGHLVGYSSNYYTYMWSLVLAKDMFSKFASSPGGLHDQAVAKRYVNAVLRPGGTLDAEVLLKRFLGRGYSFDAFEHWLEADSPDAVFDRAAPSPAASAAPPAGGSGGGAKQDKHLKETPTKHQQGVLRRI